MAPQSAWFLEGKSNGTGRTGGHPGRDVHERMRAYRCGCGEPGRLWLVLRWHGGDCAEFSEAAELVASELVTNAIRISQATAQYVPVRIWVASDRAQVVIFVWDASPLPPVPAGADDDAAENGRGLLIVQAVSAQWGWDFPHELGGKVVWAQVCRE